MSRLIIILLGVLPSCSENSGRERLLLEPKEIIATREAGKGFVAVSRRSVGGGATGNIAYDIAACSRRKQASCDLIASVFTHNGPRPIIMEGGNGFVISREDTVVDYTSFTYELEDGGRQIKLFYR